MMTDVGERVFCCECCGLVADRDLNAARNLAEWSGSCPDTRNACGGRSSVNGGQAAADSASR